MIPSFMKRLSNSLSLGSKSTDDGETKGSGSGSKKSTDAEGSEADEISKLRRQSTHELNSDEAGGIQRKSSRVHAVASVRQATMQLSGRSSKMSSTATSAGAIITKTTSVRSSRSTTHSVSRSSSSAIGSNKLTAKEKSSGSISKQHSASGSKQATSLTKKSSSVSNGPRVLERKSSSKKGSSRPPSTMRKSLSGRSAAANESKKRSTEKMRWFPRGAFLAVRATGGDEFYLCLSLRNVYNYTKQVPVRWLVKRRLYPNEYLSGYKDTVDTFSILMQVNMNRLNRIRYSLPDDQLAEIQKLLKLSHNVEEGKMSVDDIDDDVEPVILIEEPPPKKPKLKKTASQKLRDKAAKVARKKKTDGETPKRKKGTKDDGERKRKVPAKKVSDLELHPRPDIKVLEKDPLFETRTPMPYISKVANSRLVYRAINLRDNDLLKKLLTDGSRIYQLYTKSVDSKDTPTAEAVKAKDKTLLQTILDEFVANKFRARKQNNRDDVNMLHKLDTGSYNQASLGIRYIRKITASRGSREGNNAFTKRETGVALHVILKTVCQEMDNDVYKQFKAFYASQKRNFDQEIRDDILYDLLLVGKNEIAGQALKEGYGSPYFNQLLWEVLLFTTEELTNCSPSTIKMASKRLKKLTPFHCAAVNPSSKYLEKLLTVQPDVHVADKAGRTPIHYAAGCSSTANLKLLLDWGANPNQTDSSRNIPLHYAIRANRPQNVEFLLEFGKNNNTADVLATKFGVGGVNRRDNYSNTPLHLAAENKLYEVCEVLLKYGADVNAKLNVSHNQETPLMKAAAQGNLKIVRLLIEHGAVVEQKDRMGRTAVIHACKNGATSVLSYLLHIGASSERADNSGNTPIHYAAAYGWYFTLKLLLDAGVDPNVSNMWKITPIAVAYFKSHVGIVSELLNSDKVDINFPNDDGVTMIFHACSSDLRQTDLYEQIHYMVVEKKALCSLKDSKGQTPLHYLARIKVANDPLEKEDKNKEIRVEAYKQSVTIAELLLKNGCDLNAVDDEGFTATMVAIGKVANLPLATFLLKKGGRVLPPPDGDPSTSMLHKIVQNMWQEPSNLLKLLELLEKHNYADIVKDMANYIDSNGYTPLLLACFKTQAGPMHITDKIDENKHVKLNWDAVRSFIKSLVQDLGADPNAKVGKKFFTLENMPKPDSHLWWDNTNTAGRNAAHLALGVDPDFDETFKIATQKSGKIFKELVGLGADVNVYDNQGFTPLGTCIYQKQMDLLDFLAREAKCDFNLPIEMTRHGKKEKVNPLLYACISNLEADLVSKLIDCGCDINATQKTSKMNCLHTLISSRNVNAREGILKVIEKLLEKGFDFNAVDAVEKTPMHYAVGGNDGSMNQSHELEVRLIQLGVNLGLPDKYGRTALHYVFQKQEPRSGFYFRRQPQTDDPAELAKLIGRNMTKPHINHQDAEGQTALHYSAKKGATICCMYLLMIGAEIDVKDKDGNTALCLAVSNSHDGCATTLIQSGASLTSKVVEVKAKPTGQASISTDSSVTDDDSDEEDESNDGDEEKTEWMWKPATLIQKEEKNVSMSLYQAAIEKDLNGVAMFVTEADSKRSGLSELDAISMALQACKYNIALRLLCTTTNQNLLRQLGEHKQNLLHTLALSCENYTNTKDEVLIKIAEFLIKVGVPPDSPDAWNCTPIIYAVINRHYPLADLFAEKSGGYNVKYEDGFKRSYLAAALWRCHSKGISAETWEFVEKLIKMKMNPNVPLYFPCNPELASKHLDQKKCDPDIWKSYPKDQTNALITAISCGDFIISHNFLAWGSNPNTPDGNKITPLMHAIMQNKTHHVKQLLNYSYDPDEVKKAKVAPKEKGLGKRIKAHKNTGFRLKHTNYDDDDNSSCMETEEEENYEEDTQKDEKTEEEFIPIKKTSSVNLNATDRDGRTALHYVAQPLPTGTFDNAELAFVLAKAGAKLVKDSSGLDPYQLALKTRAKRVAEVLRKHFKLTRVHEEPRFDEEFPVSDGVPVFIGTWPDFKEAAEKTLKRYDTDMEVEDTYIHEVDENCNVKNGELMKDEDQDLYYDVLLTKVDVKQGHWGLYNFYQLQLVYQPGKSLYILFTRWGRIEDPGQFQHTPFHSKEEAVKEFMKIFREKTGNKWTDVKNFEQKPRKYRLVEDVARKAPPPQKDVDFNLDTTCKSCLPKHLFRLIETLMDPKAMQLTMNDFVGLNSKSLPFGQLNKERLLQGKHLLDQIEKLVNEVEEYQKVKNRNQDEDVEKKEAYQKNLEKIAELSNDYYHVIPQRNFSCEKIRPLDQRQRLMQQLHTLNNLLDYEIASKMLLAAMHYKRQYHPVDYVYKNLDCKMELMIQDDPMSQMILKYILTGNGNSTANLRIHGIYKLSRKDETERLAATGLENRRLLWHGSSNCNLLSILNRGLVIAPLEAAVTGWCFGKGIYFSDAFSLSALYIHGGSKKVSFMLLCEVALGQTRDYNKETPEERTKNETMDNFDSTMVLGNQHYKPSDWLILPSGVSIAQGYMDSQWGNHSNNTQYVVKDPAQVCLRYLIPFSR